MTPDTLFSIPSLIDQVYTWSQIWMPNLLPWFAFFTGITLVFIVARGIYEFFADHIGGFTDSYEGGFPLSGPKANFLEGPKANLSFDSASLLGDSNNKKGSRKDVYYHGFKPVTSNFRHSYVSNFQKNQEKGRKKTGIEIINEAYPNYTGVNPGELQQI